MTAVSPDRVSKVVGYQLVAAQQQILSANLPQRIAVLGEGNTANQASFTGDEPEVFTTLKNVGEKYGWGSPIYLMLRQLKPFTSIGVGGIPIVIIPQDETGVAKVMTIIPGSGPATGNATHTVVINNRAGIDGDRYDFEIADGDTAAEVAATIDTVISAVLNAPVTSAEAAGTVTVTAKWTGLSSQDLAIEIDMNNKDVGITYAIAEVTPGSGTPAIVTALATFGEDWNTIVVNPYLADAALDSLDTFNGKPDPDAPTGRYQGIIMRPFVALLGDTSSDGDIETELLWSERVTEVTNVVVPAPNTSYFPFEIAASAAAVLAKQAQFNPHLDVAGKVLQDIAANTDMGDYASYDSRDTLVKAGQSTVVKRGSTLELNDLVTTYRPIGENPPAFRWVRNLMLDWNIRYGYFLLEQAFVVDHVIANDDDSVSANNVVKPKDWRVILSKYADDLADRGMIADPDFMKTSIIVAISGTNPDRFETEFSYKRTGFARISATIAEARFNFPNS